MADFEMAFAITLKNEDSVPSGQVEVDNNGGLVKYGINSKAYPNVDVRNLTLAGAKAIYQEIFTRNDLENIKNDYIAAKVFDLCFNMGDGGGGIVLQKAINSMGYKPPLAEDGAIGPLTVAAANSEPPQPLMDSIVKTAMHRYLEIAAASPADVQWERAWQSRLYQHITIPKGS